LGGASLNQRPKEKGQPKVRKHSENSQLKTEVHKKGGAELKAKESRGTVETKDCPWHSRAGVKTKAGTGGESCKIWKMLKTDSTLKRLKNILRTSQRQIGCLQRAN